MMSLPRDGLFEFKGRRLIPEGLDTSALLFFLFQSVFILAWAILGDVLYLPVLIASVALYFLCLSSLRVWLPLLIISHLALFVQRTEGVSLSEVGFAALFFPILLIWFFDRLFIRKEEILRDKGDKFLILFVSVAVLSIVPALLLGNKLFLWLREFLVLSSFLLYFPLRDVLKDEKGRKLIYGSLFLLALIVAVKNLVLYKSGIALATYMWEIWRTRQTANEPLFMTMLIGSVAYWMTEDQLKKKLGALLVASFFALALLFTFSRGYWLSSIIGLGILFIMAKKNERRKLVFFGFLVSIIGVVALFLFLPDIVFSFLTAVFGRFFSTAAVARDISVANRLIETEAIWKLIISNPIVGYGLGAEFSFYDLLRKVTHVTEYIHNAYLSLWFKLGFVGVAVFVVAFLHRIIDGVQIALFDNVPQSMRPFFLSSIAILIAMIPISITSPQFYARDSILIISICWGTIVSARQSMNRSRPSRNL